MADKTTKKTTVKKTVAKKTVSKPAATKKAPAKAGAFLARPKGLEPPTFRTGI